MLFSASKPDLLLYLAACAAVPRALSAPPTPPPRPLLRAAGRSIRPLRGSADFSCPHTADCVLLACVQVGDGDGGGEQGRDGRLLEAIEITTTEDMNLMEELLNTTTWSCTWILQTDALLVFLVTCGSTDWCSSAPSPGTSSPSCRACCEEEIDALTDMEMLRTATGISECPPSGVTFIYCKHSEALIAWFFLRTCRAGDTSRCMGATAIQLPDFDVYLGSLWPPLIGSWVQGWKWRTSQALASYVSTEHVYFMSLGSRLPHRASRNRPRTAEI